MHRFHPRSKMNSFNQLPMQPSLLSSIHAYFPHRYKRPSYFKDLLACYLGDSRSCNVKAGILLTKLHFPISFIVIFAAPDLTECLTCRQVFELTSLVK